ncbi:MAG: hypothetical protein PHD87_07040 [Candidatus Cloacimonetes bacterium]|nr:hypothetical protein [Candidatus Cloacimonadota bacterium]
MTITNKLNLPEPIFKAIRANWYGGNREKRFASVTELLKPTKQLLLSRRHAEEVEQDASDMIWTLMGSAIHRVVEAAELDESFQEERLGISFEGDKITGGFDLFQNGVISDFKFTSVWSYIYGSRLNEWTAQLNLYAWLLSGCGFTVDGIEVITIFRDWSRSKAAADPGYPKPVERISLELWDKRRVEAYLRERIDEIKANEALPDDLIPECSQAERWEAPDRFAVMRPGSTRALRVFDDPEEARRYISEHKDPGNLRVVARSEPPKRCLDFCPVNTFCHYYRSLRGAAPADEGREEGCRSREI